MSSHIFHAIILCFMLEEKQNETHFRGNSHGSSKFWFISFLRTASFIHWKMENHFEGIWFCKTGVGMGWDGTTGTMLKDQPSLRTFHGVGLCWDCISAQSCCCPVPLTGVDDKCTNEHFQNYPSSQSLLQGNPICNKFLWCTILSLSPCPCVFVYVHVSYNFQ